MKIEALCFSCDSKLLYSLGGQDDGSVVVWDLETKQSICGNPVAPQTAGAITVLKVSFLGRLIRLKFKDLHIDLIPVSNELKLGQDTNSEVQSSFSL